MKRAPHLVRTFVADSRPLALAQPSVLVTPVYDMAMISSATSREDLAGTLESCRKRDDGDR